jgi:hypothetical protein
MKVLLAPYYFYLHYESFRRVSAVLNRSEIDSAILRIPFSAIEDNSRFGPEKMQTDNCAMRHLPLVDLGWKGSSTAARISRFPNLLINRRRIKHFLEAERPKLIVVGSDLGGIFIRLLLSCCREAGVRTMILATSASGPPASESGESQYLSVPLLARATLRVLNMDHVALFNSWRIGSFDTNAPIAVPGRTLKEKLVELGVSDDRIFITGDPAHDAIYELMQEPAEQIRNDICNDVGWPTTGKLIVYCTEVIHEMLGREYLVRLNKLLAETFSTLPRDWRVLVKLHPRETPETETLFREAFQGGRYSIRRDMDVLRLIRAANLCIGHYSRTLIDAALIGTPVVCINLTGDEKRMLFDSSFGEVRIETERDVRDKIRTLLQDEETRNVVDRKLGDWRRGYATGIDGRSSDRTASLIHRLLEDSPA